MGIIMFHCWLPTPPRRLVAQAFGNPSLILRYYPPFGSNSLSHTHRRHFHSWNDVASTPSVLRHYCYHSFSTTTTTTTSSSTALCGASLESEIQSSLCHDIVPLLPSRSRRCNNDTPTTTSSIPPKVIFLVGVSGGCDSVGLFHGLVRVLRRANPTLSSMDDDNNNNNPEWQLFQCHEHVMKCAIHVIHFDHQVRGSESDGDRIFVQALCQRYGIPCHVYYWNDDHASSTTGFSQDKARQWRRARTRQLLQELCASSSASKEDDCTGVFLTAHHADDSMESLLLKVLRGTHITNLKGMDRVSRNDDDDNNDDNTNNHWIVRPLLGLRKSAILEYLTERRYPWREDSSNDSDKYLRNKVRHALVPLLEELVGGRTVLQKRVDAMIRQSSEIQKDLSDRAESYLQQQSTTATADDDVKNAFRFPSSSDFGIMHKEALYRWVTRHSARRRLQFTYEQLDRVCTQLMEHPHRLEWTIEIGSGWRIRREGDWLFLLGDDCQDGEASVDSFSSDTTNDPTLPWNFVTDHKLGTNPGCETSGIQIYMDSDTLDDIASFHLSTVRVENLPFVPPWRKGRSPTKASQFLRGQKIASLHKRRSATIVYGLRNDGRQKVAVAIQVPNQDGWILDATISLDPTDKGGKHIFIALPNKTYTDTY